jgi:[ribosomal protein S5]-alanine N-acetyltransferase
MSFFFDREFKEFDLGENYEFKLTVIDPEKDCTDYFFYMNHPEVERYIPVGNKVADIKAAKTELIYWASMFKNRRGAYWKIAKKDDNKIVGTVGFNHISLISKKSEISYDLDFNYWGKGIMKKSLSTIVDFAINELGLCRIQATMVTSNKRSIKLLEKLKFVREGMLRKYENLSLDSENSDAYVYSFVK